MFESLFEFFKLSFGWEEYFFHNSFIFFVSFFFSILFLQSGLDKMLNFDGNLVYFKDHFKNTFFKNQVKLLLIFITILEVLTGGLSALSFMSNLNMALDFNSQFNNFYISQIFVLMTLICLFFGQRIAQDYAGAVNLAIYFFIALLGLALPLTLTSSL